MKATNFLYQDEKTLNNEITTQIDNLSATFLVRIHTTNLSQDEAVKIASDIKNLLPNSAIIGCLVDSIIFNAKIHEVGTHISIIEFEYSQVQTKLISLNGRSADIAKEITETTNEFNASIAFIFVGSFYTYIHQMVEDISNNNNSTKFVGGVSCKFGADGSMSSFVFDEKGVYNQGILLALVSEGYLLPYTNVIVGNGAVEGVYEITKSDKESILEIEHTDAKEWITSFLGVDKNENFEEKFNNLVLKFPMVIDAETNAGRFFRYDKTDDTIKLYASHLHAGQKFSMGYASPAKSVEEWLPICHELTHTPAKIAGMYSCVFRRDSGLNFSAWELTIFNKTDVCGAFLGGEIGTRNGQVQYFHGACSLFSMGDREEYIDIDLQVFDNAKSIILNETNPYSLLVRELCDTNIQFFQKVKKQENDTTIRIFPTTGQTYLKNMMEFLASQIYNYKRKICLIYFDDSENKTNDLKYNFENSNFSYVKTLIDNSFEQDSFDLYAYNSRILFFTVKNEVSEAEFITITRQIFENCDQNMAVKTKFVITSTGVNVEDLIRNCDNNDEVFSAYDVDVKDTNSLTKEFKIVAELSEIIKQDRIIPYFQGIYDNRNNCFYCYEALMRLVALDGRILFPSEFMEVSKKYNLYLELNLLMVLKVLDIFEHREEKITLNISMLDILSEKFQTALFDKLNSMQRTDNLIFELVETERIDDYVELRTFIHKVKKYGIEVAIDDFGAGYSNFIEIGNLDVDYIKINGSLTELLGTDASYNGILESIFYLSRKMEVELIAECVETASVQKQIVQSGVRFSQGYFFSKPMSLEELNIISKENIQRKKENSETNNNTHDFLKYNQKLKKHTKFLQLGGVIASIIAVVSIVLFSNYNTKNVEDMNDAFLIEHATSLSNTISIKMENASEVLLLLKDALTLNSLEPSMLKENLFKLEKSSTFDKIYLSFDGETAIDIDGIEVKIDLKEAIDGYKNGETIISDPLYNEELEVGYFFVSTPIFDENGQKIADLLGAYNLDTFDEELDLKSFGGEAFFHLCEVDGTPLVLSGNSDNLFQGGDMYDFIGTFDMQNDLTTEHIKESMENGGSELLKYKINGENRSAVMVAVPYTDWCIVSIVLNEITVEMVNEINDATLVFAICLLVIYLGYFIITQIISKNNQKDLIQALETSYYLTNSLQTSIETDSLTMTYSRATATEKIADIISKAEDKEQIHALVAIDVDNFKQINDTYGHQTGDLYLQEFVSAIKTSLRQGDIIGRMGGDEFLLLLSNIEDKENAASILDRIFDNIRKISIRDVKLDDVGVSAGVVLVPEFGTEFELVLALADAKLYIAKKLGKNMYLFHE